MKRMPCGIESDAIVQRMSGWRNCSLQTPPFPIVPSYFLHFPLAVPGRQTIHWSAEERRPFHVTP